MSPRLTTSHARALGFIAGAGMVFFSVLTLRHFFQANYPTSIYDGSFCDINAFFNCDASAYSAFAQVAGVPVGYFGVVVGALFMLGAVFPSAGFERANRTLALLNLIGVAAFLGISLFVMRSLCLICSGYYAFSVVAFAIYWMSHDGTGARWIDRFLRPSLKHLAAFGVLMLVGAYGMAAYHSVRRDAQAGGVAARVVTEYFNLPEVEPPSIISPFMSVQSTERFEDAPIRIIEYGDLLCSDCMYLFQQMERLEEEFAGKMNVAFQFFPLDAECNDVVEKNKHPGACEISYMAAHNPERFVEMHDEVFANMQAAKDPAWRDEFARRYGVEGAAADSATRDLVHRLIQTGREYEKTSDEYSHGIRSTPTMIVNNRMIIGTLPYEQLRAIFRAIVDEAAGGGGFMENWVDF